MKPFLPTLCLSLSVLLLLLLLLLGFSSSNNNHNNYQFLVHAAAPSTPCQCYNGGQRDTSVTNRCVCTCPSGSDFIKPLCAFKATDRAKVAITWLQKTTEEATSFSFTRTQQELQDHLAAAYPSSSDFRPDADLSFVQRLQNFEQKQDDSSSSSSTTTTTREIVAMYLIKGQVVDRLFADIVDNQISPTADSSKYTYTAKDGWITGLTVSTPGIFSQHFATGNILGEYEVYDGSKVQLNSRQLEFFIAALCVVIAMPLLELILYTVYHPSTAELVAEQAEQEAKFRAQQLREAREMKQKQKQFADDNWRDQEEAELPGRRGMGMNGGSSTTIYPFRGSTTSIDPNYDDDNNVAAAVDAYNDEEESGGAGVAANGTITSRNASFIKRNNNNNNPLAGSRSHHSSPTGRGGGGGVKRGSVINFSQMM